MPPEPRFHLSLVDSGLRYPSGHHYAVAQNLAEEFSETNRFESFNIIANRNCSDDVCIDSKVKLYRDLEVDIYGDEFHDSFEGGEEAGRGLSKSFAVAGDYLRALKKIESWPGTEGAHKIALMHSLSLEHIYALSLIAEVIEKTQIDLLLVCLTYAPGMSIDGDLNDSRAATLGLTAISRLTNVGKVLMYTADDELKQLYQPLTTSSNHQFEVHPCLLIGKNFRERYECETKSQPTVLLYSGDAKKDKGFFELPALAGQAGKLFPDSKILIHYTFRSEDKKLCETDRQLCEICTDDAVSIIKGHLPDSEITALIASASLIVLNYSRKVYRNKSSGFIWLGAFLKKNFIVPRETWLGRELVRLGYKRRSKADSRLSGVFADLEYYEHDKDDVPYREAVFRDMGSWMSELVGARPLPADIESLD